VGGLNTAKKRRPPRIRFLSNDFAQLWKEGETGDDLGPEYPGSSAHVFRLDKMDELVVLDDPYGRGLVERFGDDVEEE
jgi:hypothetical protein